MKISSLRKGLVLSLGMLGFAGAGCDHGLAPPDEPATGVIRAYIEYVQGPEDWPPPDSLRDLRFVAMRFVPRDTSDLLQLNRLIFSDRIRDRVSADTVTIAGVETGSFQYSGVAQKFGPDNFDWRPVGIVTANDGFFIVVADETTDVRVIVDFENPPPFPPPSP